MSAYTVAGIQMEPHIGDPDGNRERSCALISQAADAGARLVVLPEATSAGYVFADRAEAYAAAEDVPGGPVVSAWAALAARRRVWIAAGVIERDGHEVYNSAVLLGPDGVVGLFRKTHLWNDEQRIYGRSQLGFPVFDTELGRIGLAICYDAWFPETFRSVALQGADLLALPSNWVPVPGQPADAPLMANLMCMTGAHSNKLYVVGVSRVGAERGVPFVGGSLVVGPDGWPLAGPASLTEETTVYAVIDPVGTRRARADDPFNQPLKDRREDAYVLSASEPVGSAAGDC